MVYDNYYSRTELQSPVATEMIILNSFSMEEAVVQEVETTHSGASNVSLKTTSTGVKRFRSISLEWLQWTWRKIGKWMIFSVRALNVGRSQNC